MCVALAAMSLALPASRAQWLQWGGPNRNFVCEDVGPLATSWPKGGPPQLWKREIGDGYSTILVDGDHIFTMCRRGDQDAVLCLDAASGKTIWEMKYDAPEKPGMLKDFGVGPNSTPLIVGNRIFTVSATVIFHCLDKRTGEVIWKHDLMDEMKASHLGRGFSPSPIAYKDTVILPVGAPEASVAAFKQDTGEIVWKTTGLRPGHSSPILTTIDGNPEIVFALGVDRGGIDPDTGEIRWKIGFERAAAAQLSSPLRLRDGRLFLSAAYGYGSDLLSVAKKDGKLEAEQVWHTKKLKVQHGTYIQFGDLVVASSGDFGPAFLMGLKIDDGAVAWRERGFAKSTLLKAGDKAVILDETGVLALATPSAEGIKVHAKAQLLAEKSWSTPTLVGTRLYLRDRKTIMAVDLAAHRSVVRSEPRP